MSDCNVRRIVAVTSAALATAALAVACGAAGTAPPLPDPPRPTTVTVSPATTELHAFGAPARLTAEVRDQNGQVMAGAVVAWASSDASVAAVDVSGLVIAAANGSATITATLGSASGTAAVTVAQEVNAVAVSPATDTLVAGATLRLSAEAVDVNGHAVAGGADGRQDRRVRRVLRIRITNHDPG